MKAVEELPMKSQSVLTGLFLGPHDLMGDMDEAVRWPIAVVAEIQVNHARGSTERLRARIEPCEAPARVSITSGERGKPLDRLELVRWDVLPGNVLYSRCLAVLAVHWFGSIEMTPRVVGAPMWSALATELRLDGIDSRSLQFELQSSGQQRAELRCRTHPSQPWIERTVLLNGADADPMRALLRHGMEYIRPTLLRHVTPSAPAQRGVTRQTVLPTSSATSNAPRESIATPTGLP